MCCPWRSWSLATARAAFKEALYCHTGGIEACSGREEQAIRARMKELATQRAEKQPLEYPSAGSTFKRPEGYFAGKLIMDAGLRGYRVGGAQVCRNTADLWSTQGMRPHRM